LLLISSLYVCVMLLVETKIAASRLSGQ